MKLKEELQRRRTFAVISHPDAGKGQTQQTKKHEKTNPHNPVFVSKLQITRFQIRISIYFDFKFWPA